VERRHGAPFLFKSFATNVRPAAHRLCSIQLTSVRLEIATGSRQLTARADDGIQLALNGRVGRRVACVLDKEDMALEILDMAGEPEVMSDDGQGSPGFSPGMA
jgi:hypothetical protein